MTPPYLADLLLAECQAENKRLKNSRSFWRWMVVFLIIGFFITCHLR